MTSDCEVELVLEELNHGKFKIALARTGNNNAHRPGSAPAYCRAEDAEMGPMSYEVSEPYHTCAVASV